jgi:hypothetical protein
MNDLRSNPLRDTGGFGAAAHVSAPALGGPFVPNEPLFLAGLPFIDRVSLHLNQKQLYRTIERLCADLRAALETGRIRHGRRARAVCRRSPGRCVSGRRGRGSPRGFIRAGTPWLQKR